MLVARLARLTTRVRPGHAGDRARVAPTRLPVALDGGESPSRLPSDRRVDHACADSSDGSRAPAVGRAARIQGELLELGVSVSQSTVAKYMPRRRGPPSQHGAPFWPTTPARSWLLSSSSTSPSPTIPPPGRHNSSAMRVGDEAPRDLLHDRDAAFTDIASTIPAMQIEVVVTAPRSPWQNAYIERLIGSSDGSASITSSS
jgi:hypothetical protein